MPKKDDLLIVAAHPSNVPHEEKCKKLALWFFNNHCHRETDALIVKDVRKHSKSGICDRYPLIYITE